jgi:hypothetical protein
MPEAAACGRDPSVTADTAIAWESIHVNFICQMDFEESTHLLQQPTAIFGALSDDALIKGTGEESIGCSRGIVNGATISQCYRIVLARS